MNIIINWNGLLNTALDACVFIVIWFLGLKAFQYFENKKQKEYKPDYIKDRIESTDTNAGWAMQGLIIAHPELSPTDLADKAWFIGEQMWQRRKKDEHFWDKATKVDEKTL